MSGRRPDTSLVREGLRLLGVERLVLGVHDAAFPGDDDEDPGRGTPFSRGAERFCEWAVSLGFDGLQLGPQGMTHAGSASPYEATLFSRNPHNLPLARLAERGLLSTQTVERLVSARPPHSRERMDYAHLFAHFEPVVEALSARLLSDARALPELDAWIEREAHWLVPDALYAPLCREHGAAWYRDWTGTEAARFDQRLFAPLPGEEARAAERLSALRREYRDEIRAYAAVQRLLAEEQRLFRERAGTMGLALYGDLQVGLSAQDEWARAGLMLEGYRMGAPPSRTNPEGQPWGYGVLDPAQFGTPDAPGPALRFIGARAQRLMELYDGMRVDHPHGWIDPWVYRADSPPEDLLFEVQNGARLYSSPDAPGHEALRPFAIARPDQLRRGRPRYADDWVAELEDEQVARYAVQLDALVEAARERGLPADGISCEVLSTLPYPVRRVLERHGLGRFRVLQKARMEDPTDVYRAENAEAPDWVMLGNHDTPSIWRAVEGWRESGKDVLWADHLAARLCADPGGAEGLRRRLRESDAALVHALFADALASRAKNVFVFFTDLLGEREAYNAPGTVSPDNWTLRISPDYARRQAEAGLDLSRAVAWALGTLPGERAAEVSKALGGTAGAAETLNGPGRT